MKSFALVLGVLVTLAPGIVTAEPFAELRAAYASRDADRAAAAYASDGEVVYRYAGAPEERHRGRAAIAASFKDLFDGIEPSRTIDLNFRAVTIDPHNVTGLYRLRIGEGRANYGRFSVELTPDGRFSRDRSTDATLEAFEEAAGPVMLAPDQEDLDRTYYTRLTGRYLMPDGCSLVVTRSIRRLFVRDTCTQQWRGLTRLSGREWTAGDRVLSTTPLTTYRFDQVGPDGSPALAVTTDGGTARAPRIVSYAVEEVTFRSADGTRLSGALYIPAGATTRRPATVLIHGSGPQDRDGYASIIAVLADELAASGRVVLAYDKRGSGGSEGDGDRAGFDVLADDATAGMAFLAGRPEVDPSAIGLGGSSQAGWVAARAVDRGARPADVLLLGAAGAALRVSEQNLYNTRVRLECAGLAEEDISLALDQQRAFFAFLADPGAAGTLDSLTAQAGARASLADELFPSSREVDRTSGTWYVTLDPTFDPLPIWHRCAGRALFLFAEYDDSTPTTEAMSRLRGSGLRVQLLQNAQHLGLVATDRCEAELGELHAFTPDLMSAIREFARSY